MRCSPYILCIFLQIVLHKKTNMNGWEDVSVGPTTIRENEKRRYRTNMFTELDVVVMGTGISSTQVMAL